MARGVNKVILIGHLGDNPEVRHMPNGNMVANLSVATTDSWRDKQTNQPVEKTEWHRVVIFGKIAEIAGQYLRKGSKVYLEGKLQTRKWQDKQGQDRYTTEIVIDMNGQLQMLDRKDDSAMTNHDFNNEGTEKQGNNPNLPLQEMGHNVAPKEKSMTPEKQSENILETVDSNNFNEMDDEIPF